MSEPAPVAVRALFQQRIAGDDALLRLAALRFAQAGMPAQVYADHPDDPERGLRSGSEHETKAVVHAPEPKRGPSHRSGAQHRGSVRVPLLRTVAGLVVHDKAAMRG